MQLVCSYDLIYLLFVNILFYSSVEFVQSSAAFYAKKLYEATNVSEMNNTKLIQIIISRSEIDLQNIKDVFERMHGRTLLSSVKVT